VRLNRAIAVAELDGPQVALADVDDLPLQGYRAYHATRAELLRRLRRIDEARVAYDRAVELPGNAAETAYLTRRRDQTNGPVTSHPESKDCLRKRAFDE
jgi:RNA polymerase sigma-70 factor (ECF subfamily)